MSVSGNPGGATKFDPAGRIFFFLPIFIYWGSNQLLRGRSQMTSTLVGARWQRLTLVLKQYQNKRKRWSGGDDSRLCDLIFETSWSSQGEIGSFLNKVDIKYEWNVFDFSKSIGSDGSKTISWHFISVGQLFLWGKTHYLLVKALIHQKYQFL